MLHAGDLAYYAGMILDRKRDTMRAAWPKSSLAIAAAILGEALDIGKQADPIATETVASRFETAKRAGQTAVAVKASVAAEAA